MSRPSPVDRVLGAFRPGFSAPGCDTLPRTEARGDIAAIGVGRIGARVAASPGGDGIHEQRPRRGRAGGAGRVRPGADAGEGARPGPRGGRIRREADGLPRGVRLGLPARAGFRRPRRLAHARRPRDVPPILGERRRRARPGDRGDRRRREGRRRLPGHRRHRARRRHALLHRAVLRTGRGPHGQAPQADADRRRAPGLGPGGRLDHARVRHADRPPGRRHLLGELHADAPDAHV